MDAFVAIEKIWNQNCVMLEKPREKRFSRTREQATGSSTPEWAHGKKKEKKKL